MYKRQIALFVVFDLRVLNRYKGLQLVIGLGQQIKHFIDIGKNFFMRMKVQNTKLVAISIWLSMGLTMKIPKIRAWYTHKEERYLGTDVLVKGS